MGIKKCFREVKKCKMESQRQYSYEWIRRCGFDIIIITILSCLINKKRFKFKFKLILLQQKNPRWKAIAL